LTKKEIWSIFYPCPFVPDHNRRRTTVNFVIVCDYSDPLAHPMCSYLDRVADELKKNSRAIAIVVNASRNGNPTQFSGVEAAACYLKRHWVQNEIVAVRNSRNTIEAIASAGHVIVSRKWRRDFNEDDGANVKCFCDRICESTVKFLAQRILLGEFGVIGPVMVHSHDFNRGTGAVLRGKLSTPFEMLRAALTTY